MNALDCCIPLVCGAGAVSQVNSLPLLLYASCLVGMPLDESELTELLQQPVCKQQGHGRLRL
jgi:hypothetical protein